MSVAIPMVNAPYLNIQGLQLSFNSTTLLNVSAGQARNSTNVNDLIIGSPVTINTAVQGAGGIDVGTIAASTVYSVYAIASSLDTTLASACLSLSATAPTLPLGYDMFRRIGTILTDGASHILKFTQTGNGAGRKFWYDAGIQVLNAGASAAFADVALSAYMPAIATVVTLNAVLTPTGNGDTATVQPKGATDAGGYVVIGGSQAAVAFRAMIDVPCSSAAIVDYKVTGTLTLYLRAYVDNL